MILRQRTLSVTALFQALLLFSTFDHTTNAFLVPATKAGSELHPASNACFTTMVACPLPHQRQDSTIHAIPHDIDSVLLTDLVATSSFHLSAVEVFDGSTIVDPVVVSSSFWSSLQRQILSVILGQFIASVVFGILVTLLAPQLVILRDTILEKFNNDESSTTNGNGNRNIDATSPKTFIKADSIVRPDPDFGKLLVCLLIDVIGSASEALPIVGELTDVVSAPVLGLILQKLYPGSSKFVFFFEFAEEILPLTDFIPFATICWAVDTYYPESTIAELFQLGDYNGSVVTAEEKANSLNASSERVSQDVDSNINR